MNDLLTRAWNLLEPGERPEGMRESLPPRRSFEDTHGGWIMWLSDSAAYDRLCQAAERKLHVAGGMSQMLCSKDTWNGSRRRATDEWEWRSPYQSYASPDRLTSACLALEASTTP